MDGVALAAVVSSGLVGLGGLGLSFRTQQQAAKLAREQRTQLRLEKAYLEVLQFAQLEGSWVYHSHRNLKLAIEDEYEAFTRAHVDRPSIDRRASAAALLGVLGSTACQDAFRAWSKSVGEYERQRDIAFWNRDNDGGDPFQAPAVADVELMGDRAKDEATARRALAAVMAQELAS